MTGTNRQLWHALVVGQDRTRQNLKRFADGNPERVLDGYKKIEGTLTPAERARLQPIVRRAVSAQWEQLTGQ